MPSSGFPNQKKMEMANRIQISVPQGLQPAFVWLAYSLTRDRHPFVSCSET
jgi:hypothetical protein